MLLRVAEKPNFQSTQFTVVPLVHSANMSAVQYIEPNIRPFVYDISEPQYLGGNEKLEIKQTGGSTMAAILLLEYAIPAPPEPKIRVLWC